MPLYEFDCEDCGARFEELASAGEAPACPACGSERTRRAWSPIAESGRGVALTGKNAAESNARRREREARRREGG